MSATIIVSERNIFFARKERKKEREKERETGSLLSPAFHGLITIRQRGSRRPLKGCTIIPYNGHDGTINPRCLGLIALFSRHPPSTLHCHSTRYVRTSGRSVSRRIINLTDAIGHGELFPSIVNNPPSYRLCPEMPELGSLYREPL